jgi:cytosine/adenosine deaminase-related metal-dependent hydrolase
VTNIDDGGTITAGAPADLLLLDWAAIDDDGLREDIDVLELTLTRATARHISELIVGGRTVVKDGALVGVDLPAARAEILAQIRAGLADIAGLSAAMPALERAIALHFEPDSNCC